jgi:molybdenum cofactor cytidylyltransferase
MRPVSIAGIILAAGASTRLGRSKQDVVLNGETLLDRAIRVATEAALHPILVIVRPASNLVGSPQQPGFIVIQNNQAAEGMASSLRLGIRAAQQQHATGAVVMTCDQVLLTPQHLEALCQNAEVVTGSRYAGRIGVPAYFPAAVFADLLKLQGDAGARDLLRNAAALDNEDLALDIDTEQDLQRAMKKL